MVYNFCCFRLHYLWESWLSFQYKDVPDICLCRYTDSHCRDKIVVRPSYLYQGNSLTFKTTFLYWNSHLISRYIAFTHERKTIKILDSVSTLTFCRSWSCAKQVHYWVIMVLVVTTWVAASDYKIINMSACLSISRVSNTTTSQNMKDVAYSDTFIPYCKWDINNGLISSWILTHSTNHS